MPLVKTSKVSGRGGWKTANYGYGQVRVLNEQESTDYEKYCAYCERIGCPPGSEVIWYVTTLKITPRSL